MTLKIQSLREIEAEMRKVAGGEIAAPADAAAPTAESAETLAELEKIADFAIAHAAPHLL